MLQLIIGESVAIQDLFNDIEHSDKAITKSDELLNFLLSKLSSVHQSEDKFTDALIAEMFNFPTPMQTKEQAASTAKDILITYNDAKNMIPGIYSSNAVVPNTLDVMNYSKPLYYFKKKMRSSYYYCHD